MLPRLTDFVTALVGALAGSQVPALYARYTHEVGARVRQAREGLDAVTAYAQREGMAVHEALDRLRAKGGIAEAAYTDLHDTYTVLERLEPAYTALTNAGPLTRPIMLLRHMDTAVAGDAFAGFTPALPLSGAGAAYAAGGALVLLLAGRAARMLAATFRRRLRRARSHAGRTPTDTHGTPTETNGSHRA